MTILTRALTVGLLACGALDDSPIAIQNRSTHVLTAIELAAVAEQSYEPSLLVAPLRPGGLGYARIACGRHDVRLADDRGRQCVLANQPLCFEREPWVIDDVTLETCRW